MKLPDGRFQVANAASLGERRVVKKSRSF